MTLNDFIQTARDFPSTPRMPTVFIGHGSPMNAIERNIYTRAWEHLGETLPQPNAILCISAHWLTRGTCVEMSARPQIIYDFYGFPEEMYRLRYDCPGAPEYAQQTIEIAKGYVDIQPSNEWGIDHGTWVVLKRMYPRADIPVFQLSIDMTRGSEWHYQLGKALRILRERGVLIVGSGNIVHNLGQIVFSEETKAFEWAQEFDAFVAQAMSAGNHVEIIQYEKQGLAARLSIPTPDHYIPLLYCLGLRHENEHVSFPVEGIVYGSISMRCVVIG